MCEEMRSVCSEGPITTAKDRVFFSQLVFANTNAAFSVFLEDLTLS